MDRVTLDEFPPFDELVDELRDGLAELDAVADELDEPARRFVAALRLSIAIYDGATARELEHRERMRDAVGDVDVDGGAE